jgi:hypothetical protein
MPAKRRPSSKPSKNPASDFGQRIGNTFEVAVIALLQTYLAQRYVAYELVNPIEGRKLTLQMTGGLPRQIDNIIALKNSDDPVALLETKWLKDARHHNDKGAWILQLREIRKNHATIRGVAAILAGYWTEGVGVMLQNEGGVKMVLVATDEEVYSTLQTPLNDFLGENTFRLDAKVMRQSYPRPEDLVALLLYLEETKRLNDIVASWFEFERGRDEAGNILTGRELIQIAIDELLAPLPPNPSITSFEITLQIETGNTIHQTFTDLEEAQEFLSAYHANPQFILDRITPKKRS